MISVQEASTTLSETAQRELAEAEEVIDEAIHEAKAWITNGRAEEYTIACRDLDLLRVTTKGVESIQRHSKGEAEVRKGIAELLVWEQITKPLFLDGPVIAPERDDPPENEEEDVLDAADESEES